MFTESQVKVLASMFDFRMKPPLRHDCVEHPGFCSACRIERQGYWTAKPYAETRLPDEILDNAIFHLVVAFPNTNTCAESNDPVAEALCIMDLAKKRIEASKFWPDCSEVLYGIGGWHHEGVGDSYFRTLFEAYSAQSLPTSFVYAIEDGLPRCLNDVEEYELCALREAHLHLKNEIDDNF